MSKDYQKEQANKIGRGKYAMLKDRPCKVIDTSHCKTGKHGSGKTSFTAIDMFTGKKIMCSMPATCMIDTPVIRKNTYVVADVEDGMVNIFNEVDEMITGFIKCTSEEEEKINEILDEGDCSIVVIAFGDEMKLDQIKKEGN